MLKIKTVMSSGQTSMPLQATTTVFLKKQKHFWKFSGTCYLNFAIKHKLVKQKMQLVFSLT